MTEVLDMLMMVATVTITLSRVLIYAGVKALGSKVIVVSACQCFDLLEQRASEVTGIFEPARRALVSGC